MHDSPVYVFLYDLHLCTYLILILIMWNCIFSSYGDCHVFIITFCVRRRSISFVVAIDCGLLVSGTKGVNFIFSEAERGRPAFVVPGGHVFLRWIFQTELKSKKHVFAFSSGTECWGWAFFVRILFRKCIKALFDYAKPKLVYKTINLIKC